MKIPIKMVFLSFLVFAFLRLKAYIIKLTTSETIIVAAKVPTIVDEVSIVER